MATTRPAEVELSVPDDVPERQLAAVRRRFELLARYADEPLVVHATVRRAHAGQGKRPYIVDAYVVRTGTSRALAAHASAPGADAAAEKAADRLRRQLRRVVGADVALRNDPRTLQRALADLAPAQPARPRLKPPDEREIVRRRTYSDHPQSTYEAISDLLDDDELFRLFVHARTREDVVVHRLDDGEHIGLLHPQGSALADESDEVVVPEPSRYSEPIAVETARAEMDLVLHRFLYFIDAGDGRGKVLYPRRDGDYGLVEPE
jgi:ribosome-associated translation inhibitor RaiA